MRIIKKKFSDVFHSLCMHISDQFSCLCPYCRYKMFDFYPLLGILISGCFPREYSKIASHDIHCKRFQFFLLLLDMRQLSSSYRKLLLMRVSKLLIISDFVTSQQSTQRANFSYYCMLFLRSCVVLQLAIVHNCTF